MKAGRAKMFSKGQQVLFKTGPRGSRTDVGTIVKVHNSGKTVPQRFGLMVR